MLTPSGRLRWMYSRKVSAVLPVSRATAIVKPSVRGMDTDSVLACEVVVIGPHLVLDPVLLVDVGGFEQRFPLLVRLRHRHVTFDLLDKKKIEQRRQGSPIFRAPALQWRRTSCSS